MVIDEFKFSSYQRVLYDLQQSSKRNYGFIFRRNDFETKLEISTIRNS